MKYFLDFLAQLKKGVIAPVYLFYGPENYLRDQAVRRLQEQLLPPEAREFDYHVLDGGVASVQEILLAASFAPVMAGRRLVVVRDSGLFQSSEKKQADESAVLEYLMQPSPETCLVFDTGKGVDKRRKLYKEAGKVGCVLEFTRLKPAELVKWLAKQAGAEGCGLQREAAEELLSRCGRDMYTLYNEIKKLTCYAGFAKSIGLGVVRELVTGRVDENIFEVVDAVGEKDCRRALSGIRGLLLQKQQPQQIIGMVARQFRLILQVRELAARRESREQIIAALKMHPYVYQKIYRQHKNFDRAQLVSIANRLAALDYDIKTGRAVFYPAMETLLIKICAGQ
ncbi:MAG: DNA polymerase III subunit delta [Firmicutes bacterium]|nr:DNA polymerase III subunit delta [Bacillota bacterium]